MRLLELFENRSCHHDIVIAAVVGNTFEPWLIRDKLPVLFVVVVALSGCEKRLSDLVRCVDDDPEGVALR